ncbi:MAG: hypothetical protein JW731_15130 [Bacteroidales bacterium]|nr:hypothetical protein [Bacteroidales bacterium]
MNKHCRIFLIFFLIFSVSILQGQKINDSIEVNSKIGKIGLSGFAGDWVTNSSGVQLGFELSTQKKKSFEWDLSYIFKIDKGNFMDIHVDDIHGIKSNLEFRSYFSKKSNFQLTGFYWTPAFVFQYTRAERSQTLDYGKQNVYYVNRYFSALN